MILGAGDVGGIQGEILILETPPTAQSCSCLPFCFYFGGGRGGFEISSLSFFPFSLKVNQPLRSSRDDFVSTLSCEKLHNCQFCDSVV